MFQRHITFKNHLLRRVAVAMTLTLCVTAAACDEDAEIAGDEPALGLTVRLVDKNDYNAFVAAHAAYRAALDAQPGVGDSRLFNSFFSSTAADVPSVRVALTELTAYDSEADYRAAMSAIASSEAIADLDAVSAVEADILVRQPDGSVDVADFDGASLEIAVRGVTASGRDAYQAAQQAFLAELDQIADVKTVEFEVVGDDAITAGYSTYATQESLQETLAFYTGAQVAFDFFGSFDLLSSQFGSASAGLDPIAVPDRLTLNETAAPEDIVVHNHVLYVSDIATGSVLRIDLFNQAAGATVLVPPASEGEVLNSSWGLRIDEARNRLLVNYNPTYGFDGNVPAPCQLRAYDLSTGELVGAWDLPEGTIGNPVVVDSAGNYYVGDIGPDSRIVKVDPETDAVEVWADASEWPDGGFGLGGMVYDGQSAIYGVHATADLLYRIPIEGDGTAGALEAVTLLDDQGQVFSGYAADGMAWADGTLYYAFNDVQLEGPNGVIYQVDFDSPTTGMITEFQTGIKDPSGVFAAKGVGTEYLFVNESQLGHAFGVDPGSPDVPFKVLSFAR